MCGVWICCEVFCCATSVDEGACNVVVVHSRPMQVLLAVLVRIVNVPLAAELLVCAVCFSQRVHVLWL